MFDELQMHADAELEAVLGARLLRRITIHEWPLSRVQRLELADGRVLAYKTQLPPSVEVAFYDRASSSLLVNHRALGRLGRAHTMVIDWIDAPLLRERVAHAEELFTHGREIVSAIGRIEGSPPTYLDISSAQSWRRVADDTLNGLETLVTSARFERITNRAVNGLQVWANSREPLEMVAGEATLTHGDLKADQVFLVDGGYRVIDWQRPVLGPRDTDLVSLLVGERMDPWRYVVAPIVQIFWFLRLHWAVQAQVVLFPTFAGDLFERWAGQAVRQILTH